MSGSTAMYSLKPIIGLEIPLNSSNVMYKMKNIHKVHQQNGNHSPFEDSIVSQMKDQVTAFLKEPLPDLKLLEKRQEKILSQLAELKKQVATLCDVLKSTNRSQTPAKVIRAEASRKPVNFEIILNVCEKKSPFSILALSKLWSDSNFPVQAYIHSTVTGTFPEFENRTNEHDNQKNVINLKLIWKNVSDLQLNTELSTCTITGEVNFLRYVSRLVETHNYENSDPVETNLMDSILDLCYIMSHQSPKEAQAIISNLGVHLAKGPWLLNKTEPSIVDIAAWSVIKQLDSKLPPKLAKWFQNCEKTFL